MNYIDKVRNGIIVSCQALEDEPLHSSFIMSRMALAAEQAGAVGIRANSVVDIQAIQSITNLPIIGIYKKVYGNNPVFITPTLKEVRAVAATGVEVVAMDATLRDRPNGEKLEEILNQIKEEYPNTLFMADIATVEEAIKAEEMGFDLIGTTLHGYTKETEGKNISDNDFVFLKEILKVIKKPVIVEGKIDTPYKAKYALKLGADTVVVGSAITRPQEIAEKFVDAL